MAKEPWVKGFTTNPTLMRKAGITDYEAFAKDILSQINGLPISFEVFSDDLDDMRRQALLIASWSADVYVKIPVTNTQGIDTSPLVRSLVDDGVKLNVTALMTEKQVESVGSALGAEVPSIISVFAGRIADTGRDPVAIMTRSLELIAGNTNIELLWASPREILNLVQADEIGCHIITMTNDLLAKVPSLGKDLDEFSLDTVRMFHADASSAGFAI